MSATVKPSPATLRRAVLDLMADVEAKQDPATRTLRAEQVPAPYAALVQLALPGRRLVYTPTLQERLQGAVDTLDARPPAGPLGRLGLVSAPAPTAQQARLVDELAALVQVRDGARAAHAARLGARGLR
jgi:hypothetical protein